MTHPTTSQTPANMTDNTGVRGGPRYLLRIEGLLALGLSVLAYSHLDGSWAWFAALFLMPDLVLLGYLGGPRLGAALYNIGHSFIGPALLAGAGWSFGAPALLLGAVIWTAHIGFDRALGYGMKYASGFRDTHLGRVGRTHAPTAMPTATLPQS